MRPRTDDLVNRLNQAEAAALAPDRAELRRLADATRSMIDRLAVTGAPVTALAAAADHVEAALDELAGHPRGRLYEGFAETGLAGGVPSDDPRSFFDHSPIIGGVNPLAPPVQLRIEGGVVYGTARFGAAYEGPPGCVHGGYVAAAFDEVLGMVQSFSGRPGMTGTLEVRYRRPTPLHTDLRFDATLDRQDGRKLFTSGRLHAGDELTAEAKGLFISVDAEKIARLLADRAGRS